MDDKRVSHNFFFLVLLYKTSLTCRFAVSSSGMSRPMTRYPLSLSLSQKLGSGYRVLKLLKEFTNTTWRGKNYIKENRKNFHAFWRHVRLPKHDLHQWLLTSHPFFSTTWHIRHPSVLHSLSLQLVCSQLNFQNHMISNLGLFV